MTHNGRFPYLRTSERAAEVRIRATVQEVPLFSLPSLGRYRKRPYTVLKMEFGLIWQRSGTGAVAMQICCEVIIASYSVATRASVFPPPK